MTNQAREVLIRFECREQCAAEGESPCFELDPRLDPPVAFEPCDLCQRLTDARLAALAEAGVKCLGREPTLDMCVRIDADGNTWQIGSNDVWRAMWDASK